MSPTELQALLKALRSEIDTARFKDAQEHARLSAMLAEIETQLLSAAPGDGAPVEGVIDGLRLAVDKFELEHPRFAGLLNQLISALSAMGI
jgi:hypothetical protein